MLLADLEHRQKQLRRGQTETRWKLASRIPANTAKNMGGALLFAAGAASIKLLG